jgi:L-lactate dehydrogenase complex protein LldE
MARRQAQHTITVFGSGLPVVVPSGSCAAMIKLEYPHLLHDDPVWHTRAQELAARTFELGDFLVNQLGVVDVGAHYEGKVAYHYACHLRGLGLVQEAELLIRNVQGATYVPLPRQDQCCGFGGSFSVRYPQVSGAMVSGKANCILQTEADALVSTDAGCLMNIGGRLRRQNGQVEVLHLAELLEKT